MSYRYHGPTSGWNLPPGCFESDLPGNSDAELACEAFCDSPECEAAFQEWQADDNPDDFDKFMGTVLFERAFAAWREPKTCDD